MNISASDAATVARVRTNREAFLQARAALTADYACYAGIFEVNIEELLEIIERLTRPAESNGRHAVKASSDV